MLYELSVYVSINDNNEEEGDNDNDDYGMWILLNINSYIITHPWTYIELIRTIYSNER